MSGVRRDVRFGLEAEVRSRDGGDGRITLQRRRLSEAVSCSCELLLGLSTQKMVLDEVCGATRPCVVGTHLKWRRLFGDQGGGFRITNLDFDGEFGAADAADDANQ